MYNFQHQQIQQNNRKFQIIMIAEQMHQLKKENERLKIKVKNLEKKVVELDQQILIRCRNYMFKAQRTKNQATDSQEIKASEKQKKFLKFKIQNPLNLLIKNTDPVVQKNINQRSLEFSKINLEMKQKITQLVQTNLYFQQTSINQNSLENLQNLFKKVVQLNQVVNQLKLSNMNLQSKLKDSQQKIITSQQLLQKLKETNNSLKLQIETLNSNNQKQKMQLQTLKQKIENSQKEAEFGRKQILLSKQRFTIMSCKMLENIQHIHTTNSDILAEDFVDALENQFKIMVQIITIYNQLLITVTKLQTFPEESFLRLENSHIFQRLFETISGISENAKKVGSNSNFEAQTTNKCKQENSTMYTSKSQKHIDAMIDNIYIDYDQQLRKKNSIIETQNKRIYELQLRQSTFKIIVQKWCKQNRQKDEQIDYLHSIIKNKEEKICECEKEIFMWQESVIERDKLIKELNNQISIFENSFSVKNELVQNLKLENTKKEDYIKKLTAKLNELLNIEFRKSENYDSRYYRESFDIKSISNKKAQKQRKSASYQSLLQNNQRIDNKYQSIKMLKDKNDCQSQNISTLSNMYENHRK